MLDEPVDESEAEIISRLSTLHHEETDLRANIAAISIAKSKLEHQIEAAASEARQRVGERLITPYYEITEELKTLLERASELNRSLHEIHRHAGKQDLRREIHQNRELKPLGIPAAWGFLTIPNGQPSLEYQAWKKATEQMFQV